MGNAPVNETIEHLPFFVVPPGETDVLFIAVAVVLVLVVLGFGALYFTIQAWPDRIAKGVGKAQLQLVGILGLVSLLTLNNWLWVAALLLAAIRVPDLVTPLRDIARSLKQRPEQPPESTWAADPEPTVPAEPVPTAPEPDPLPSATAPDGEVAR